MSQKSNTGQDLKTINSKTNQTNSVSVSNAFQFQSEWGLRILEFISLSIKLSQCNKTGESCVACNWKFTTWHNFLISFYSNSDRWLKNNWQMVPLIQSLLYLSPVNPSAQLQLTEHASLSLIPPFWHIRQLEAWICIFLVSQGSPVWDYVHVNVNSERVLKGN